MLKTKTNFKQIIAILMLLIIICSSMPVSVFAKYITDMNSDATFGAIPGGLSTYGHELHYAKYDNATYMLFCCQYGATSPNGGNYAYNQDFQVQFNNARGEYRKIAQYIYFGYTMTYGLGLPQSTEAKQAACATQQFVWEYIKNNIDSKYGCPSRDSWKSPYMSSSIYSSWLSKTENYYNSYHNSNVAFNNQTNKVVIGESKTFSDSNGVLASYPSFNKNINGITFNHSQGSNDLIVSVDGNCNVSSAHFKSNECDVYRLMPNGHQYNASEMSSYMYFKFSSGSIQDLMFSNYADPTFFNINIEVESGKISLKKVNNMGNAIEGCEFGLYADENCTQKITNVKTSNDGTILFDKLKPKTYFIKELSVIKGYLLDNSVKRVDVVAGQTATVEFKNNEPTGEIVIYKVNNNGDPVGDAEFTIRATENIMNVAKTKTYYKKGDTVAKIKSDKNTGIASIVDMPLGKFEVFESQAPSRIFTK